MQAAFAGQQQEMVNLQRTELVQHRAKSQQLLVEVCDRSGNQTKVFGDIVLYILHESSEISHLMRSHRAEPLNDTPLFS